MQLVVKARRVTAVAYAAMCSGQRRPRAMRDRSSRRRSHAGGPRRAEIVLIAHEGGLFTVYPHLDDTHAPPPVKVGDAVRAGDPIGGIGLAGITTGPHLHFVIRRGNEPIDPSGALPHS